MDRTRPVDERNVCVMCGYERRACRCNYDFRFAREIRTRNYRVLKLGVKKTLTRGELIRMMQER